MRVRILLEHTVVDFFCQNTRLKDFSLHATLTHRNQFFRTEHPDSSMLHYRKIALFFEKYEKLSCTVVLYCNFNTPVFLIISTSVTEE